MAEQRPELPEGYLGSQGKFVELGMSTLSHPNSEFALATENEVEIKFKTPKPVKVNIIIL